MTRIASLIAVVLLAAVLAGCANTRWGFLNRDKEPDVVLGPPPSKEAVVAYLNENASRLQSVRADDVDITVHAGAAGAVVPIGLRGNLMTQKPRAFRLAGSFAAKQMVDLGSNDEEFWWWISKDNPPDQYFCRYDDLNNGRVPFVPFPFQPEWIMETMGLGPYGPADKYEMTHDKDTLRLIERARSPQGRPIRKVIVMKRTEQKAPSPQVLAFLLLDDATGNEICSAEITAVDVKSGAIFPRRLDLRWPDAKIRLAMNLGDVAVNTQLPQTAFQRPTMNGVRSRDLARLNFDNPMTLQRVQGFSGQ
jgi:hypothetical protein